MHLERAQEKVVQIAQELKNIVLRVLRVVQHVKITVTKQTIGTKNAVGGTATTATMRFAAIMQMLLTRAVLTLVFVMVGTASVNFYFCILILVCFLQTFF